MKGWWKSEPVTPTVFKYRWRHIPTNTTGIRQAPFANRTEFLIALRKWNQDKNWIYSEENA